MTGPVERWAADRDHSPRAARRIHIRPVHPEDDVDLIGFYDGLDSDGRVRRFFTASRPRASFFSDLASVDERGGAGLVAVLHECPPTGERIVGEASYRLLPNGDGELGIAVARPWRAWLTCSLLDALASVAAAAGVPNLEADVLTADRAMLALLRSRGSVAMEHRGWRSIRVLVATADHRPTWPGRHDRPRVLVESSSGRWPAEDAARSAGCEVLTCAGAPDGAPGCPAVAGDTCPLAVEADVIVVADARDDERVRRLLAAHAAVHPGVPVVVDPTVTLRSPSLTTGRAIR